MIRSMTGFSRLESTINPIRLVTEMKSTNHRHLDLQIRVSKEFHQLEEIARKVISSRVHRGRIDIYITVEKDPSTYFEVTVNEELAERYRQAASSLANKTGLIFDLSLSHLLQFPEVIRVEYPPVDLEHDQDAIRQHFELATSQLLQMRTHEGHYIAQDLRKRMTQMITVVDSMQNRAPLVVDLYRERLRKRIYELIDELLSMDDARILTEVALFAEKSDIEEERVRLFSHILQFDTLLESKEPVGRKMDFLLQEMNREVNTIGSKSGDAVLSQLVVEAKSILEQLREQVQNIE